MSGHVVWSGRLATDLPARTAMVVGTPFGTAGAEATQRDPAPGPRSPALPVDLLDGDGQGLARG